MKWITRSASGCIGFIFLLCICFSLVEIPGCTEFTTTFTSEDPGGEDYDPPLATCANAGIAYPDNPFSGWPQNRSWGDVNYYYCDPLYLIEFGRQHWGIDIEAYNGEPVYATADGFIVRASEDNTHGMGKNIKICTPTAWCAIYMHLDSWAVSAGDNVSRGQIIGYADNTGFSTGPHLHYQIEDPSGQTVDPAPTLAGGPGPS